MTDVTQILTEFSDGDPSAGERLLPLVYEELRRLAAARLAHEKPGQTLQATALVHEAYLRLVNAESEQGWDSRGHFFAAAAEAMRRILIDHARRKRALKHGGEYQRAELDNLTPITLPNENLDELLALDEALSKFEKIDLQKAELVKMLYFAGLNLEEAAAAQGISRTTAYRHWLFARAWLKDAIDGKSEETP